MPACAPKCPLSLACAAAALQALATLGRGEESRAMGILAEVLDALGAHQLAKPLEEQARRAGR